ncbi:hypothetical protein N656DRAFT_839180 [Canariomyces notabilis]|uniref:PQ loop repeat protein n=1 Tax=Canariomyces notabilis TaxID=2074819 RepID=A0AAN6QFW6_9PEZI|nr:hypothetical protein N656DRAFT_839180 [Canariomyces arenarius]
MGWFTTLLGYLTPAFLILSPLLSYSDQAYSMYRTRSSAGFSLDIPLIMLVASLLRIFYFPGARYDNALLIQSFVMVFMQVIILKIALDHRPAPYSKGGEAATPFARVHETQRPFNFWQWRAPKPYWQFLLSLFVGLVVCELLLAPIPVVYQSYSSLIGIIGLSVEATLPLPQILANARSQSCKGFRVSVLASWLVGDAMKMFWFFTSTTSIPLAFKVCGMFQAACDLFLGFQYMMYGDGEAVSKSPQLASTWSHELKTNGFSTSSGRDTPPGRRTSSSEKAIL